MQRVTHLLSLRFESLVRESGIGANFHFLVLGQISILANLEQYTFPLPSTTHFGHYASRTFACACHDACMPPRTIRRSRQRALPFRAAAARQRSRPLAIWIAMLRRSQPLRMAVDPTCALAARSLALRPVLGTTPHCPRVWRRGCQSLSSSPIDGPSWTLHVGAQRPQLSSTRRAQTWKTTKKINHKCFSYLERRARRCTRLRIHHFLFTQENNHVLATS